MIPWWSAILFLAMGAVIGIVIVAMVSANDDPKE